MRGAARTCAIVVAVAIVAAACSSGSRKPRATTTPTTFAVNLSDPVSLTENGTFVNLIHTTLPQFCDSPTFRRNITTPPELHLPPIGGQAECIVWHQFTQNFAFKDHANVANYVRARTALECKRGNPGGPRAKQVMFGLHWVLRPHSATLATSNDYMHVLAAVLRGSPHTQFCKKPVNYAGAWNEMSAITILMKRGGFNCGTLVIDIKNPLYLGKLLLDSHGKPLAIHALCSANRSVQVIGISPVEGDPTDVKTLKSLQQYYCKQDPSLHAIRGITGMTIVKDDALATTIGKALTTAVEPVCSTASP